MIMDKSKAEARQIIIFQFSNIKYFQRLIFSLQCILISHTLQINSSLNFENLL